MVENGTTACKWDTVIPFAPLWEAYKRVIVPNGAIVLFGSQPFTSALVMSNLEWFKYEWVWQKTNGGGFLNANRMPLKRHENILVFGQGTLTYNPQKTEGKPWRRAERSRGVSIHNGGRLKPGEGSESNDGTRYPLSVQLFANSNNGGLHPTQKPSALFDYLINTYTNPGDLVLDSCMGSATTPVACLNTGRHFIGIEKNDDYFSAGCDRVRARQLDLDSTLPL